MHPYSNVSFFDRLRAFFEQRNTLPRLIMINILVFLCIKIISVILWLSNAPFDLSLFFAVPASLSQLLKQPWGIFTYMFLHERFFHLFFNMIVLYIFGEIFLQYFSQRKLMSTYICGGLVGGLFYIVAYNLFPVFEKVNEISYALGASASILAILIVIATYVPDYRINLLFIGPIKLKYFAIAIVIIDILSIPIGNAGGHIAHLGGAFWGFLYIWLFQRGIDMYVPFNKFYLNSKEKNTHFRTHKTTKTSASKRPVSDEDYNARRAEEEHVIDKILDKIAKGGYDSLSSKEKEILFKSSNRK